MKQSGRPRREDEQPDSPFGRALKQHIRRIEHFTQADLAHESMIAARTLSRMVKGKRIRGTTHRRDLRAIIQVLYQRNALQSLAEANALITTIPAIKELDVRDPEDAEIISLLETPVTGQVLEHPSPTPLQTVPGVASEPAARPTRKRLWLSIGSGFVALALILGVVPRVAGLILSRQTQACIAQPNGVTLYIEINYQGQCHTFGPGDYELSQFGLEENVSSIKDPNHAYHIKLFDKAKNYYEVDKDTPVLPAEWDNRADTIHIEKHRPTSCTPGTNGILAFLNTDYSGGCLFITGDIPDLTALNFEKVIVSIQFLGSYQNTRQLVLYNRPGYQEKCGAYWQDQSDLLQCARAALSLRVLPFTPPTPIPTLPGTRAAGNVASLASLSPGSAQATVDGKLQTEWIGGHLTELDLNWAFPIPIHRVVVWDRKQSLSDNNQINKLKLTFSDGTSTGSLDMISQGPRCVDIVLPVKTITWLHIIPVDASGNNGLREVEVWAATGPQYSNNTCVNKVAVSQTIPQAAITHNQPLFNIAHFSCDWCLLVHPAEYRKRRTA